MLEVGRVAKPHGVRGEVVVELRTDRTERVAPGAVLVTKNGRRLEVVASRPHQHRFIVSFDAVVDRAGADALHGAVLHAEPLDDPEELWAHDLIGASVIDVNGQDWGEVEAVQANPASDLLVLRSGVLVPAVFLVERRPDGVVVIDPPEGLADL
ncbi:MAG: rRNA processing protein RimM [Acidimicrobiaceae bacterium]